jgi:hypothetical protein
MLIFDANIMESYLSIIVRKHGERNIMEEIVWQNVQNAELKLQNQKRLGKWQADQTKQAKECN